MKNTQAKHTPGPWSEGVANARLIAAAPELLEAAKALLADFTSPDTDERIRTGPHVALLQQVIAKAEGREA